MAKTKTKKPAKPVTEFEEAMRGMSERNIHQILVERREPGACLRTLGTAHEFKRKPEVFLTVDEQMAGALQMCQSVISKGGMFELSERLAHQYANEALDRWRKS